jgi:hypothetical protein
MQKATLLIVGCAFMLMGCGGQTPEQAKVRADTTSQIIMIYDPVYEKMVPDVKPGTIIELNVTADFRSGDPCDHNSPSYHNGNGFTVCPINAKTGKKFTYRCKETVNCDPEIAVDDTGTREGFKGIIENTKKSPLHVVSMFCMGGATQLDDSPVDAYIGERVRWTTNGDTPLQNWVVTLQGSSAKDFCEEGTAIFSDDDQNIKNTCTLSKKAPKTIQYTVMSGSCNAPTPAMAVINVKDGK